MLCSLPWALIMLPFPFPFPSFFNLPPPRSIYMRLLALFFSTAMQLCGNILKISGSVGEEGDWFRGKYANGSRSAAAVRKSVLNCIFSFHSPASVEHFLLWRVSSPSRAPLHSPQSQTLYENITFSVDGICFPLCHCLATQVFVFASIAFFVFL